MKLFNCWYLSLVFSLGLGSHSCAQNKTAIEIKEDEQLIEFTTDRFTLPNLHVTPDGKSIIFDVLGDIYQVPIEGGRAEILLQDNNWKRGAKLSPDGKTLTYVSDETGEFQVWTVNLETKEKQVYPIKEYIHYPLNAYWGSNNQLLISSNEGLQRIDVVTERIELVRPIKKEEKNLLKTVSRKMTINKTGTYAYYQFDGELWVYDLNENIDKYIGRFEEYRNNTLANVSPNGNVNLYYTDSQDSLGDIELIFWDMETNSKRSLIKIKDLGFSTNADYSFDFINDSSIILDKEGEIVRMNLGTGEYEPIPIKVEVKKIIKKPLRREPQYIRDSIITASVLRNPVTKSDLDTIYFGAFGRLHSYAKNTKEITEIYTNEDRFEVSPSLSPDGKYLAYTSWNDTEMGHVYVRELKTGKEYQLTKTSGRYINPAWSPDGTEIVFLSDETEAKMGIRRLSGGANTYNYSLDLHQLKVFKNSVIQINSKSDIITRIFPLSNKPKRFYPIPVYNANNKSIFITTRNHEKDLPVLIEIDLETKKVIDETLIPFHTDEVVVSPNAQHIAFIFDEQVWINCFPFSLKIEFFEGSEFIPEQFHYKGGVVNNVLLPKAKSIYEIAPSYLSWQDENILMWGSANEIYTYDIRTGKTEQKADIKVQQPRAIPKGQFALINATIITMNKEEEIIEKGTILVKNNRIEAVGKIGDIIIPKRYKVFDLKGKTIMPGIIDVHAHYHQGPYEIVNQQDIEYLGSLTYGITTIFDPNSNTLDYREHAQMVETGKILGPRIFSSGNIIFPFKTHANYYTLNSFEDSERLVLSFLKLGVYGPIKDYLIYNSKTKRLLYDSAITNGLSITTHQERYNLIIRSLLSGYTGLEHAFRIPIQDDILKTLSMSKINFTPTYLVTPGIGGIYNTQTDKNKLREIYGDLFLNSKSSWFYNNEMYSVQNENIIRDLISLVNNDVKLSVGGHGDPLPGIGTHWEMWFFSKGMNNYDVLKAATINGAEKLDLQKEIGSIEKNKLADILVLNNNPLDDIFSTIDIQYTILNGAFYEADTMKQIYPIEKGFDL